MNPNEVDLFGGFAGAKLEVETFHFGVGIVLSRTSAHLMAPFVMAFAPPSPGSLTPPPGRRLKPGLLIHRSSRSSLGRDEVDSPVG